MLDNWTKPSWEDYFLTIAFVVSQRSIDQSTRHGCVIVDKNRRIVSTGYNSPPSGMDDKNIPQTRPDKYPWFLHSEENAVLFAKTDLSGCSIFITGFPCSGCMRKLSQMGITDIYYSGVESTCVDHKDREISKKMAQNKIRLHNFTANKNKILSVLGNTLSYVENRVNN